MGRNVWSELSNFLFLEHKLTKEDILCAIVVKPLLGQSPDLDKIGQEELCERYAILKMCWDDNDFVRFAEDCTFKYFIKSFQQIYGIIYLKNGSWIERVRINGVEQWQMLGRPKIPKILQEK